MIKRVVVMRGIVIEMIGVNGNWKTNRRRSDRCKYGQHGKCSDYRCGCNCHGPAYVETAEDMALERDPRIQGRGKYRLL